MASIIQIKNGSGSNEPANSQLSNAELAINVDTGQLWYGSGSTGNEVTQSKFKFKEVITDTLTAQQYVVSSSVTFVTTSFSDGSTIFGDEPEDTHKFTGSVDITGSINAIDVNASKNISALNITASSSTGSFTGSFLGTFTSADIVALKLESASLLSYTASNDAEIVALKLETASLLTNTASVAASITSFKLETASLHTFTASFTGTTFASLLSYTASNDAEITSLKTTTASLIAEDTSLKTITASLIAEDTSLKTITASLIAEDTSLKTKTASLDASITSFKSETASLHTFTASGFQSPLSMSVGTAFSNTTNPSGIQLYIHGNASGSNKLSFATASFGTRASNTTNVAGVPLYVHGKISASNNIVGRQVISSNGFVGEISTAAQPNITQLGELEALTAGGEVNFSSADAVLLSGTGNTAEKITIKSASIGTNISNTTNPSGMQLYVHGNASASGLISATDFHSKRNMSSSLLLSSPTASFGIVPSHTTNIAGTPLYVHGKISASGFIEGRNLTAATLSSSNNLTALTASIGTLPSQTTNLAGVPLYVHGNVSASGNVYSANEKTIVFVVYVKSTRMDKWWGPKKFGCDFYQWNQQYTNPDGSQSRLYQNTGFPIPEKAKYVSFQVSAVLGTGTANMPITASMAIVESLLDQDNTSNSTLVHLDSGSSVSDAGGTNYDQIQINSSTAAGQEMPKNSVIYPRFRWGTDQTAANVSGNAAELYITLQFKYIPIP